MNQSRPSHQEDANIVVHSLVVFDILVEKPQLVSLINWMDGTIHCFFQWFTFSIIPFRKFISMVKTCITPTRTLFISPGTFGKKRDPLAERDKCVRFIESFPH